MEKITKRCCTCGTEKDVVDFFKNKSLPDGRARCCKVCAKGAIAKHYHAHPDRNKHRMRKSTLKRYGLTTEDYSSMLSSQGGVCAICYRPNQDGRQLFVDHCHATGSVRKLLCMPCNSMLGMADDVPDRLRAAAAYLEQHQSAD